ncbi:DNA-methyltransferase [Pseudomonas sp. AN-1]|uniref:DNA-methyltransferase n=1 Tax=Pseudomonas sp. AN-1 TaxID=3096605 RepID=UPI002A69BCEE|nr:DNA methyltransferase [Pseudomonas sp. AN-1]WPP47712.1 DNA methyltransferase [Pseudomonas sp. AN-1]
MNMQNVAGGGYAIHVGDCLESMRALPDSSVDSIVTDPPYGLSFMGKKWDCDVPSVEVWAECLRVLKPGGHLLAFAGTRTQHRMACRIEDAGFEIRDMIAWAYGSGFPKSRDASEAMARHLAGEAPVTCERGVRAGVYEVTAFLRAARDRAQWTNRRIDELFATNGMAGHWTTAGSQPAVPSVRQWAVLKDALGFGDDLDTLIAELAATERPDGWGQGDSERAGRFLETLRTGREQRNAVGWGTALKPALEPITVARKPMHGTVAANVTRYGTGALNIDGCRIGFAGDADMAAAAAAAQRLVRDQNAGRNAFGQFNNGEASLAPYLEKMNQGRWPANLVHDGSAEVAEQFGDAARFFYCAKASKKDRGEGNSHPTVKPTDLMRYLCRLVTPPGGLVLDPFTGSGSTGKAAMLEGFRFIGCELLPEYAEIALNRIQRAAAQRAEATR